jgi:dienelactone hydrolase
MNKNNSHSERLWSVLQIIIGLLFPLLLVAIISCAFPQKSESSVKETKVTYTSGGVILDGYVFFDKNKEGKRPGILVVHEWWGLNNYALMRAKMLAESGYIAMAVDMFGNGRIAANPNEAQELTMPFYKDPNLAKARLEAAISKLKEFEQADSNNMAAIGYCFGGSVVLNSAKLGVNLKGVVSFHGGLAGVPPKKDLLKAKILVCHGGNDQFVPQKDIDLFKQQLDAIGAIYSFKIYPDATHAFTNPDATRVGKEFAMPIEYNEAADKKSWNDMILFFNDLFKN